MDGNEGAAWVAYRASEVIAIYPITPATPMGELADAWSSQGIPNAWGAVPQVVEMQSAAAAGGCTAPRRRARWRRPSRARRASCSCSRTCSRSRRAHARGHPRRRAHRRDARSLDLRRPLRRDGGAHDRVRAARSSSVQEAHDLALVAHAATLRARVPFLHFFDGFRTSHELSTVQRLSEDDVTALLDEELAVRAPGPSALARRSCAPRQRAESRRLLPGAGGGQPLLRCGPADRPGGDGPARRTDRPLLPAVRLRQAPGGRAVLVLMGWSGAGAAERPSSGCATRASAWARHVRLYRPFDAAAFVASLPAPVSGIAVLDCTKERGRARRAALPGRRDRARREDSAASARASAAATASPRRSSRRRWRPPRSPSSRGTSRSGASRSGSPTTSAGSPRSTRRSRPSPEDVTQAVFYDPADGTVGANRNSIRIIAEATGLHAQAYFVLDSKKAGSTTVSHLRFGRSRSARRTSCSGPTSSPATSSGSSSGSTSSSSQGAGRRSCWNAPFGPEEVWGTCPRRCSRGREGAAACRRRIARRTRGRPRQAREHRSPDVLLRARRRHAPGRRRRGNQGSDPRDLREAW